MSAGAPLGDVRRIAVLRPNAVGDFVFALPALHAFKQRYPGAELVYIGKAWHRAFLHGRPGPVDRVSRDAGSARRGGRRWIPRSTTKRWRASSTPCARNISTWRCSCSAAACIRIRSCCASARA